MSVEKSLSIAFCTKISVPPVVIIFDLANENFEIKSELEEF